MLFKNVDPRIVDACAESIGAVMLRQSDDPRRAVLRPSKDCVYRRVSASWARPGRKVNAVCWHGHRDFFRALFIAAPDAIVETKIPFIDEDVTRYSAETFENMYEQTDRNIGSMYAPMLYSEACTCPEGAF